MVVFVNILFQAKFRLDPKLAKKDIQCINNIYAEA